MAVAAEHAVADDLPTYTGAMSFPAITGPEDPEQYSWEVELFEGQVLESIDSRHVAVYYPDDEHHLAYEIVATAAHDASGADVPTTIAVAEENVLTLTVHHRAGNASGAPFAYPIVAGEGWLKIGEPTIVVMPLPDGMVRETEEAIERANRAARPDGPPASLRPCRVPHLKGRSLKSAKLRLRKAHCMIGQVRRRRGATAATGRVVKQSPGAGRTLAAGGAVSVTLAP